MTRAIAVTRGFFKSQPNTAPHPQRSLPRGSISGGSARVQPRLGATLLGGNAPGTGTVVNKRALELDGDVDLGPCLLMQTHARFSTCRPRRAQGASCWAHSSAWHGSDHPSSREARPRLAALQDQQLLPEAKVIRDQQHLWPDSRGDYPQQTAKHSSSQPLDRNRRRRC